MEDNKVNRGSGREKDKDEKKEKQVIEGNGNEERMR